VRFHAGTRGARGNYSPAELDAWADRLRGWSREADVFAYFNNDWEGFAPANARGLRERLGLTAPTRAPARAGGRARPT
jgi:uncharacterized protein YecE (DUF72 family)